MDRHSRNRYSRQAMFAGIGEEGQEKLGAGVVAVVGCGALGCASATLLVRAGIGKVRIIDRDFVEYHNLHRQVLFTEEDVTARVPKSKAAERYLQRVNSSVQVEGIAADVNYTNIEALCGDVDVIVDGSDNHETRFLINDFSLKHRIPWVYGSAVASHGMTMTFLPGETPCFRCLRPTLPPPGTGPTCETAGIIGTLPTTIGSLQATEAIKLLVGAGNVNRRLLVMDVWNGAIEYVDLKRRNGCLACLGHYEWLENRFLLKATSLCSQSRSVQVVNAGIRAIALDDLAASLKGEAVVARTPYALSITAGEHEIAVFPDGRAIVRNTTDEAVAKDLYLRYVDRPTRLSRAP